MLLKVTGRVVLISWIIVLFACSSYYAKYRKFNQFYENGELVKADALLAKDKKGPKRKAKLLWYFNRGTVQHLLGNYDSSNYFFEQALIIRESIDREYLNQAIALVYNPNIVTYKGESHEWLMLYYYKALNYLYQRKYEAALVECRRMQTELMVLNSKYRNQNTYREDAFIHLMMGLIYDADKDYQNAFIAYRNALKIYEEEYKKLYQLDAPNQLLQDVIRTGYKADFAQEASFYEKKYNLNYNSFKSDNPDLVFLWMNGLAPVKDQWDVTFIIEKLPNGETYFYNAQFGWRFRYPVSESERNSEGFKQLSFVRIALPKYIFRGAQYTNATLQTNEIIKPLELSQDINKIAKQSLDDRVYNELGTALMRLASKKIVEFNINKQNATGGTVASLVNALSEQADTRNWQTLPAYLSYTRIPLQTGTNTVVLNEISQNATPAKKTDFIFEAKPKQTIIKAYHNLSIQQMLVR